MKIEGHPEKVCHFCGTRYGYKPVSHLSSFTKVQCDICGKAEPLADARNYGEIQLDWKKQYEYDVRKGIQPW